MDALLADAVETGIAPGLVGAATSPAQTLYMRAAGVRSGDPRREMQLDSVFRLASMTKPVTSLAVLMLVADGRLELDAPFTDYVPGYRQPELLQSFDKATKKYKTRPAASAITVRQLLTHTSGYGYWFLDAPLLALTKGAPELFNPPFLMHAPGARFAYSVSTDVLGQIVEPVAGMPLAAFLERRIFAPLGMRDTGYAVPQERDRLVTVHARINGSFAERPNEEAGGAPRGGGGLYSTAADYLRFLRFFLNDGEVDGERLLSRELVDAMTRNQIGELFAERQKTALPERTNDFIFMDGSQKFGFGFMVETRAQATGRSAGSYGWAGIFNTYFWVDPNSRVAGALLTQTTPFADPTSIGLYRRFERAVYAAFT